jgi:hypothetical protein
MRKFIRRLATGIVVALADRDGDCRDTGGELGGMRERLVESAGQHVRATTSGMRERLVVGSGRRRLQATTGNDTYTSTMRERLVVGPAD